MSFINFILKCNSCINDCKNFEEKETIQNKKEPNFAAINAALNTEEIIDWDILGKFNEEILRLSDNIEYLEDFPLEKDEKETILKEIQVLSEHIYRFNNYLSNDIGV